MTSFIERKVNEICGRWLDGFTKDNVDVSLLQAKITLSDLHFKTDELCLLSPTFAPSLFYVGKLSVDIPLAWNFSRPVKIVVSDVLALVRVSEHESMTPEDIRKSISANVHVKAILSKLAAELGGSGNGSGSGEDDGKRTARINVQTARNLHKVMQKLEVTVKNAHLRVEEPSRDAEGLAEAAAARDAPSPSFSSAPAPAPTVAFGVCLRGISLGLDERADVAAGGGSTGERWFGKKFRAMETVLLGNYSPYDGALGNIQDDAGGDARRHGPGDGRSDEDAGHDGNGDVNGDQASSDQLEPPPTLVVTKFASVRGLSAYFCRDDECYSAGDREETLRRLRAGLKSPPTTLPPLLQRCRAGLGVKMVLSAKEWGKIDSTDLRLLVGDINLQLGDDHVGYLLRWASLLDSHVRTLALSALRPTKDLVAPTRWNAFRGGSSSSKSRYYRALWRHAVELVLRDLRESGRVRGENAWKVLRSARAARSETVDRPWSSEQSEYREARALLWRTWFAEWVTAARYLSLRQLMQPYLVVECFTDESGGIHNKLYEDLDMQPKLPVQKRKSRWKRRKDKSVDGTKENQKHRGVVERKLAKYLMPWQLPQEDTDKAWGLISRKTLRWELRQVGGSKLAIDEEEADHGLLDPAVLQALWSIQLQLDAQTPHRICAFARRMAVLRVAWRNRIDRLWQARAEKQRRLGLGEPPAPPRLTPNGSLSYTGSEAGLMAAGEAALENSAEAFAEDVGDGADRVGTLLVRMGQLDGVGGVGVLSLAPKAVATLMLEESSATLEEMDLETNTTQVAKYDSINERCCWDQTFRLQVELNEDYVHHLRRERMKKCRRALTSSISDGLLSKDISPAKGDEEMLPGSDSVTKFARSVSGGAVKSNGSLMRDSRTDHAASTMSRGDSTSFSPVRETTERTRRADSMESTRSQASDAVPLSSFLLAVSCVDKSVFGVTQLGTMTLPGKQLTSVPLKVLEHRCALFSPAAVGRQPRELTLETVFVPPGEDVALAEQELSAIEKRMRLQEQQETKRPKPTSSAISKRGGRGSSAAINASGKPRRISLDNVGEREVKVLSLAPRNSTGGAVAVSNGQASASAAPNGSAKAGVTTLRSIPIVDTETPARVSMSVRAAGVTVVTYLNSSAALARAGCGSGGDSLPRQDTVVTLTETSVRQMEGCVEVDVVRGKVALALEAAAVQLVDKSLLQQAAVASALPERERPAAANTPRPQLMIVGPVCAEVVSTRYVGAHEHSGTRTCGDGDGDGNGTARETPATATSSALTGSQVPSHQKGRANRCDTDDGRDRTFWDSWASWPMRDWRGRLKLGAYTAELRNYQDRHRLEEVWRRFRFSLPRSALEDTQILRGGTADSSGSAKSSSWLLRAGARGLSVDVQMPKREPNNVSRAPSPQPYVYVSSSDESENDSDNDDDNDSDSDIDSPPVSPLPSLSPQRTPCRKRESPSRLPSEHGREASVSGHDSDEGDDPGSDEGGGEEMNGVLQAAPGPSPVGTPPVLEHWTGQLDVLDGSLSTVTATTTTTTTVTVVDQPDRQVDRQAPPSSAELMVRVQELEGELKTLRAAAAAATAASIVSAGCVGGET